MTRRLIGPAMLTLACLMLWPAAAQAQSAIVGIVRDTSGAVLPGVTVEATSDALIERTRAATTDGSGQYRIVDLRPGTYVVSFTLTGFSALRREGLELAAEFTATINAEMTVGSLTETITVSGAAPVVDVTSAAHVQVLDRETLDNIPTGRTIQGIGQVIVGINLSLPDVGGSRAAMQTYMSVHGQSAANNTVMVDGMTVNGLEANGAVQSYFNDAASQEMSYQTSAIGAETSSGGVRLNLIPKEGGNRLSGDLGISYRPGEWQGDNLTQRLIDAGLTAGNSTAYIADFTASQGGPIRKDRIWFFASFREYRTSNRISNTFFDDGSQGDDFNLIRQGLTRLTFQVSPRHKLSAYYDRVNKFRAHDMQSLTDPETASEKWTAPNYHTAAVKYTGTLSNKILAEAGFSENIEYRNVQAQDGISQAAFSPEWYAGASRTTSPASSARIGSPSAPGKDWPGRRNIQGALSYVTGAHHIKTGAQWQWGTFYHANYTNADLTQRYSTTVRDPVTQAVVGFTGPVDVIARNTPVQSRERLKADLGLYVQDNFTWKRLSVNAGVRWEYLNSQVDAMESAAGRFVPARSAPEVVDLPNWTDWAPRFQVVYDLFGNSKTAIKYSANRYNAAEAVTIAAGFNPLTLSSTTTNVPTMTWVDLNGDDIAQGQRTWNAAGTAYTDCTFMTPGCEINLSQLRANFGLLSDAGQFAGYPRAYNIEQGVEIQHELLPRLSVTGTYYRGYNKNLPTTINRAVTPADFTPVTIYNPVDGSPITFYNQSLASIGRATDSITFNDPDRYNRYRSFSGEFRARIGGGAQLFGGVSWEREVSNATSATAGNCTIGRLQNPNQLRFCDRGDLGDGYAIPYVANARLNASYPLPWGGVVVSGSFQSNDSGARAFSYTFTRTTAYPNGSNPRFAACPAPCTPGATVLPTLNAATATVTLFPSGTEGNRNERLNQLDLKVSKNFRFGNVRVAPTFEAFNITNSDTVISYSSTAYGNASYRVPNSILQGRILGFGAQVRW